MNKTYTQVFLLIDVHLTCMISIYMHTYIVYCDVYRYIYIFTYTYTYTCIYIHIHIHMHIHVHIHHIHIHEHRIIQAYKTFRWPRTCTAQDVPGSSFLRRAVDRGFRVVAPWSLSGGALRWCSKRLWIKLQNMIIYYVYTYLSMYLQLYNCGPYIGCPNLVEKCVHVCIYIYIVYVYVYVHDYAVSQC